MRKSLYVECRKCGERWKVATLPITLDNKGIGALKRATCPNCHERKELFVCPTDGEGAVTVPRDGSDNQPEGE